VSRCAQQSGPANMHWAALSTGFLLSKRVVPLSEQHSRNTEPGFALPCPPLGIIQAPYPFKLSPHPVCTSNVALRIKLDRSFGESPITLRGIRASGRVIKASRAS
jgi:hypothetical protein